MNELRMPDKRIAVGSIGEDAPRDTGVIIDLLARLDQAICSYERALAEHERAIRYVLLPSNPQVPDKVETKPQMSDLAQQLDCLCNRLDGNTFTLIGMTKRCEL